MIILLLNSIIFIIYIRIFFKIEFIEMRRMIIKKKIIYSNYLIANDLG